MISILEAKQQATGDTPLFLFDCELSDGTTEHWSTHRVSMNGVDYEPRVIGHSAFEFKAGTDTGADLASKITLQLSNADSYFSEIVWSGGWKGAKLTVHFLFFSLSDQTPATPSQVVFQGIANSADEITESTAKVTFTNRLNLQRVGLPEIRIQKRCPWLFPATVEQRQDGLGSPQSPFYRCGYSPDVTGGEGLRQTNGSCFTTCDYTRAQCEQRGMFSIGRFGGVEFVPPSILVRSYGDKSWHLSSVVDNEARYNDFVPVVYGTAWYQPPVVFARNDGNLTRMEVLLAAGEIAGVIKVVVNGIEIPQGVSGADMTGTGWYQLIATGSRSGGFNPDFTDSAGNPAGDPYGSMAAMSVVVPNRISTGQSLPKVEVLLQGALLDRYDTNGAATTRAFTNNPAWVLLDVLRRCGWSIDEVDLASFATAAARCDETVQTVDVLGNATAVARFECNLVLRKRRSAADVVRGIRAGSSLILSYGPDGRLRLIPEGSLAEQQSTKPAFTNSTTKLNDGWPAYEFSDGSAPFSGIMRKENREPSIRFWSRPASDTPNRLSVEFQDELNEYQQDSLSLVDVDDATLTGQEVAAGLTALGIANFSQATRVARLQLNKSIEGNLYVEFGTSVRGFGLVPGDIIALTYEKEGLTRQPFRVQRVAPGLNYRTAVITAQLHEDAWYVGTGAAAGPGARRQSPYGIGIPRPLLGTTVDSSGDTVFGVTETLHETADGVMTLELAVDFVAPGKPASSAVSIPLVSLTPLVESEGGTIHGGQTLYYGISGVDAQGAEGRLSFTVKAAIPTSSDTNKVTLRHLSFSAATETFRVYRGATPAELVRIATDIPIAEQFEDTGIVPENMASPPDENYDHANFYWRLERQPEVEATTATANTIANDALTMPDNEHRDMLVRITHGRGRGQERLISANTATTLTISPAWDVIPDVTSRFAIAEPSWQFAALTVLGPARFEVPGRQGATIHILGRSANVHDQECAAELSVLTRWQLGGGSGDADVPAKPTFALAPTGQGTIELSGISFSTLDNTRSIASGTLGLLYWDELTSGTPLSLLATVQPEDTTFTVDGSLELNDILQVGREIVIVTDPTGPSVTVDRAAYSSAAAIHTAGSPVYRLSRRTYVIPFARGLFGSPAGGSFHYPIFLPDVRIGAAHLFVTNDFGNSPTANLAFTATTNSGIRTLSGGQFSIQLEGTLGIQTNAAPLLVIEDTHSVRDVYAVIREVPLGGDIELRLTVDGLTWCTLTIPAGTNISNVVDGFTLPPLNARSQVSLDIVSVPDDPTLFPGRDLTVTIRL